MSDIDSVDVGLVCVLDDRVCGSTRQQFALEGDVYIIRESGQLPFGNR